MRIFFVLLLLANVGFFAWQYQARGGLADRDIAQEYFPPTDPGVMPLILLSERTAPSAAAPAAVAETEALPQAAPAVGEPGTLPEEAADAGLPAASVESEQLITAAPPADAAITPHAETETPAAPAVVRRCYVYGPSADRGAIERAAATARQAGARANIRESVQTGADGYWVRLPEVYSLPEARTSYRELQRRGVDDIAIVPLPDKRYFISLGVYKKKNTLEERRKEIIAKGVTPLVEDRTQVVTVYTLALDYTAADPAVLQSLQGKLSALTPQITLQEVACE